MWYIYIHTFQGYFIGVIIWLSHSLQNDPEKMGFIDMRQTKPKHHKAQPVHIFLDMYCNSWQAT